MKWKLCKPHRNNKLITMPGEVYNYSNTGVGLLGVILERISGKTYYLITPILPTYVLAGTRNSSTPPGKIAQFPGLGFTKVI